jgi:hypothetical protein
VNNISIKKVEASRRSSASSFDEKAMKKEESEGIASEPSTSTAGSDNGATDKASVKRMECDSSVPSPPKNQHNIADTIISAANSPNHIPSSPPRAPRPSCRSDSQSPAPITSAVERSDSSGDSRSSSRSENKEKSPETKKPAPVGRIASLSKKSNRKSNEVEQLLKDLCEGNTMWSHMRRMELKKPTTAVKEPEKKKTLRLEERQKKLIEKKKGHKMLKQISDESSDGESDNESEKKKQWSSDSDEEPEIPAKTKELPKKRISTQSKVKPKETKAKSAWDTTPTHSAASSTPSTSLLVKAATAITSGGRMSSQKRKKLLANDNKEDKKPKSVKEKNNKKSAKESTSKASKATNNRRRLRKNSTRSSDDEEDILKTRPFTKGRMTPSDESDLDDDDDAPPPTKRFSTGSSFALDKTEDATPAIQTTTAGDLWETCAFRNCKKPQTESLNWVQCDDCCAWYHTFCILGKEVDFEDDEPFSCGCKLVSKKKPPQRKSLGRKVTA